MTLKGELLFLSGLNPAPKSHSLLSLRYCHFLLAKHVCWLHWIKCEWTGTDWSAELLKEKKCVLWGSGSLNQGQAAGADDGNQWPGGERSVIWRARAAPLWRVRLAKKKYHKSLSNVHRKNPLKQVLAALAMEWGLAAESDGGFYQCWRVQEVLAALQAAYVGQCIHVCATALASLPEKGKTQTCISCSLVPFPQPRDRHVEHPGLILGCRIWWGDITADCGGCSCKVLRVMLESEKLRLERKQRFVLEQV